MAYSVETIFNSKVLAWLENILHERFGHKFIIQERNKQILIRLKSSNNFIIFDTLLPEFYRPHSQIGISRWDAVQNGYRSALNLPLPAPSVNALPHQLIEHYSEGFVIHYDILGLTFWMLTRLEEVDRTDLDAHGRFPSTASHAYKHGYLERPIVDEWLHILGQVIERNWPGIKLKKHQYSMRVSHDVDAPSLYAFKPWKTVVRMMATHILKRLDFDAFCNAPMVKLGSTSKLHNADPYNTFEWLMDLSDFNNLTSTFYFICGRTSDMDADYELEHPAIRELMRCIHSRGHQIGLHPSYGSYQTSTIIKSEADRLRKITREIGIEQSEWGCRMHYLRWAQPTTLRALADAGMTYDSTLGYADRPGFRCGTSFEFPAFDPVAQEILPLRIRPLIVMECSVISESYMGLGYSKSAEDIIEKLKSASLKCGGTFSLLWHNSNLNKLQDKAFYEKIISL